MNELPLLCGPEHFTEVTYYGLPCSGHIKQSNKNKRNGLRIIVPGAVFPTESSNLVARSGVLAQSRMMQVEWVSFMSHDQRRRRQYPFTGKPEKFYAVLGDSDVNTRVFVHEAAIDSVFRILTIDELLTHSNPRCRTLGLTHSRFLRKENYV